MAKTGTKNFDIQLLQWLEKGINALIKNYVETK
jgi:hypothetical protein